MNTLYWKSCLVRTPFERVALSARHLLAAVESVRHPELRHILFEPACMTRVLRRILRPDSNCIDIGCHLGTVLSQMVKLAPHGKHMAFEPIAEKAAWLRVKFPEVEIKQLALADQPGIVEFCENIHYSGYSRLRSSIQADAETRVTHVPCEVLDHLIDSARRVDFMKVDVEGAELKVLHGAVEMIRRDQPFILFESTPDGGAAFSSTPGDLFALLESELGYRVFFLRDYLSHDGPMDLDTFLKAHEYPYQAFNYLAARLV